MSIFAIFWSRAERLVHVTPVESQEQAQNIDAPQGHDLLGTHERPDDLPIHEAHNGKSIFTEIRELLQTFGGNADTTAVVVDDGEQLHAPVNVVAGEADPQGATDAANEAASAAESGDTQNIPAAGTEAAGDTNTGAAAPLVPEAPVAPVPDAPAVAQAPVEGTEGNAGTQDSASEQPATDAAPVADTTAQQAPADPVPVVADTAAADQTAQAPEAEKSAEEVAAEQAAAESGEQKAAE